MVIQASQTASPLATQWWYCSRLCHCLEHRASALERVAPAKTLIGFRCRLWCPPCYALLRPYAVQFCSPPAMHSCILACFRAWLVPRYAPCLQCQTSAQPLSLMMPVRWVQGRPLLPVSLAPASAAAPSAAAPCASAAALASVAAAPAFSATVLPSAAPLHALAASSSAAWMMAEETAAAAAAAAAAAG